MELHNPLWDSCEYFFIGRETVFDFSIKRAVREGGFGDFDDFGWEIKGEQFGGTHINDSIFKYIFVNFSHPPIIIGEGDVNYYFGFDRNNRFSG